MDFYPRNIFVEITDRCNLNCKHCIRSYNSKNNEFISLDEFEKLTKQLESLKFKNIILTGGEPLLHPKIDSLLRKSCNQFKNVYLDTNGILLSKKKNLEMIKKYDDLKIQISLDGNKKEHEFLRGKGTFKQVMNSVKELNQIGKKPIIGTVLYKKNHNNLSKIAKLLSDYDIMMWRLMFFMPGGRGQKNKEDLQINYNNWKKIKKQIMDLETNFKIDLTEAFKFLNYDIPDLSKDFLKRTGCEAGKYRLQILTNGDVLPCSMLDQEVAGNYHDSPIKEIWNNSKVLLKYRNYNIKKNNECKICDFLELCKGGCHGLSKKTKGTIYSRDPRCPQIQELTLNEILRRFFEVININYFIGVPGSNSEILKEIGENSDIDVIVTNHEEQAAYISSGYYKTRKKNVVCFSSIGPGATNLITGISAAYYDHLPIIFLSSQVPKKKYGEKMLQEMSGVKNSLSQIKMIEEATIYSKRLEKPKEIIPTLKEIYKRLDSTEKGPMYIEIPEDFQDKKIKINFNEIFNFNHEKSFNDTSKMKYARRLIKNSKKPVILVGGGVNDLKYREQLRKIIEETNIPVVYSMKGKGVISDNHNFNLGLVGVSGVKFANNYVEDSDLVIVIGSSLHNLTTFNYNVLDREKDLVRVDEISKNDDDEIHKNQVQLIGKYKIILRDLFQGISKQIDKEEMNNFKDFLKIKNEEKENKSPMSPVDFILELDRNLPKNKIICSESIYWTGKYTKITDPNTHIVITNFAPIGASSSEAIGTKLSDDNKFVVSIQGDTGFLMSGFSPLLSSKIEKPILYVILNNGTMGPIYHAQKKKFNKPYFTKVFNPDFEKLSESMYFSYYKVEKIGQISNVIKSIIDDYNKGKSVILESIVDKDVFFR